jgi:hypothetical protein
MRSCQRTWKKLKKGKRDLMLLRKGKQMFADLKSSSWAKMCKPGRKMGSEAGWEGPYYIF